MGHLDSMQRSDCTFLYTLRTARILAYKTHAQDIYHVHVSRSLRSFIPSHLHMPSSSPIDTVSHPFVLVHTCVRSWPNCFINYN